jgi:hypothetical protein
MFEKSGIYRFYNNGNGPMNVWIEPWVENMVVPVSRTLVIRYKLANDQADRSACGQNEDGLVFYCEGSEYTAKIDGKDLTP